VLLSAASFPIGDLAEPRVTTNFLTLFDIIIIFNIIQCNVIVVCWRARVDLWFWSTDSGPESECL